jgi:gamma-glutamyltranspeptidase/glutathione hydrolase
MRFGPSFSRRATLAGLLATSAAAHAGDRPIGRPWAGRSTVIAKRGMAATSQPLATQAALDILKAGGSAADAAIAANACLALMEPVGCGLGGDLFAIVWDPKTSKLHGLNASGPAPGGRSLVELQQRLGPSVKQIPAWGEASVTVPGAVDGWLQLNEKFGKLRLADVLAPAIGYARDGFPVSPIIASQWARNMARLTEVRGQIPAFENAQKTFLIDGAPPRAGQVFRNRDLAATMTNIAVFGRSAFYEGAIAERTDAFMRRIGGALRLKDMVDYRAQWVEPIMTRYRDVDVWQLPPNVQGMTVLQMLNILEGYDLRAMGFGSAETLHLMVEAKKLAFQDRARYIADPAFARAPLDLLLSKDYAATLRNRINALKAAPANAPPLPGDRSDTIYLAAADGEGMMVSLIQSNYRGMGGGLVVDGTGFMLQNRGSQFNLDPTHPNAYAPRKRPFHTIIPGFASKNNQPWLAFGVMGGAMQPQGHVQIISNLVDHGMDLQEAGDAPRWRHIGGPDPDGVGGVETGDEIYLESGFGADVRAALAARGHAIKTGSDDVGGYQAVMRQDGVYFGATELRKDGQAAGY